MIEYSGFTNDMKDWVKSVRYKRKTAYQKCLKDGSGKLTFDGQMIIKDLAKFCNAHTSLAFANRITGNIDPIAMAIAEGRREVFNRIQYYLNLTDDEIFSIKEIENE
jgi:hypothetical protein